mmetsp:Transcript_13885/g.25078  ORF Transcript_13885/g.25078 Transcript_13885/m.25078 type:complete len:211 (-) Transcript_13885:14-646(-)
MYILTYTIHYTTTSYYSYVRRRQKSPRNEPPSFCKEPPSFCTYCGGCGTVAGCGCGCCGSGSGAASVGAGGAVGSVGNIPRRFASAGISHTAAPLDSGSDIAWRTPTRKVCTLRPLGIGSWYWFPFGSWSVSASSGLCIIGMRTSNSDSVGIWSKLGRADASQTHESLLLTIPLISDGNGANAGKNTCSLSPAFAPRGHSTWDVCSPSRT